MSDATYGRESLLVRLPRERAVGYQTSQVCSLLFAEGTRRIFITADTSMRDSVTFKIVSRRKEAAIIPGTTITFMTVDGPQILLDVKLTRVK